MDDSDFPARLLVHHHEVLGKAGLSSALGSATSSLRTSPWETQNVFTENRNKVKILLAFSSGFKANGAARINNTSMSFVCSKHCMLH